VRRQMSIAWVCAKGPARVAHPVTVSDGEQTGIDAGSYAIADFAGALTNVFVCSIAC
jgi:hypothetical protein